MAVGYATTSCGRALHHVRKRGKMPSQGRESPPNPEADRSTDGGFGELMFTLRLATPADIPALGNLIEQSVRALSVGYYTGPQVESALRYVFGPDTQLI